jgi:hypothetical protein
VNLTTRWTCRSYKTEAKFIQEFARKMADWKESEKEKNIRMYVSLY